MTDVGKIYLYRIHVVKVYTLTSVALGSQGMFMSKFYLQVKHSSLMFLFLNPQIVHYHSQNNKRNTTDSLLESY